MNKGLLITFATAIFLIGGTFLAINFAKGYRLNFKKKKISETGLLVVNSLPNGASVYLNNKLTTATNNTLNLPPGDYQVKINKDGYSSWQKTLKIEKELVTQANARLFPSAPDLKSLTSSGASNVTPSPNGEKIAFCSASASAKLKNGLWVLDLTNQPISLIKNLHQVSNNTSSSRCEKAELIWSPDSKQILFHSQKNNFLLEENQFNDLNKQLDITARLSLLISEWEERIALKNKERLRKLPKFIIKIATQSAQNVYFSPDEEKILYTATASATIPDNLIPHLPASNTQKQTRKIEPDGIYVYDLKEDKNFYLAKTTKKEEPLGEKTETRLLNIKNQYSPLESQPIQWFPDSNHLIFIDHKKLTVIEYDATNQTTVYAGPFDSSFAYPWPNGSKLVILTNLNSNSHQSQNLYAINLK